MPRSPSNSPSSDVHTHDAGGGGGSEGHDDGDGGGGGGGGKLVKIAFAHNQAEAEMLQGLLTEAGIPSVLKRSGGFDNPDFLAAGPHDVMVNSGVAQKARGLLADTMIESEDEGQVDVQQQTGPSRPAPTEMTPARLALWVVLAALAAVVVVWVLYELS